MKFKLQHSNSSPAIHPSFNHARIVL